MTQSPHNPAVVEQSTATPSVAFPLSPSPYACVADPLRDQGYHVIPIKPGSKVPGIFASGEWSNLPGWQRWCSDMPPAFISDTWETWPNAGIGIAHGVVVGLDVDTDRADVRAAIKTLIAGSPCNRRGSKGWIGYYLPPYNAHTLGARLRWHDADGKIVVELLMHGTQSVLPPTIHPDTRMPYVWEAGSEALQDVALADLPRLPDGIEGEIDVALMALGITRGKMRQVSMSEFGFSPSSMSDLEKPAARSLNERALEPVAINAWWPAMGLPKTRQRGNGAWSAVADWRSSGSGRSLSERNPNIGITPSGIRDFGPNVSYTAIDVVMAAKQLDFNGAVAWLTPFCRAENGPDISGMDMQATAPAPAPTAQAGGDLGGTFDAKGGSFVADPTPIVPPAAPVPAPAPPVPAPPPLPLDRSIWEITPSFDLSRKTKLLTKARMPTKDEFMQMVMNDPGPFPIQNPERDCPGLLGQVAEYLEDCSTVSTEAGGLAVALPMLGAMMGRGYETNTGLRANIYTVGIGNSGTGKTSLMNPAKELMIETGNMAFLGQDRIASGAGLLAMLTSQPQRMCFLDEFGKMLQQMTAMGAGGHSLQILTEFTALYSAAGSLYTGTAYASRPAEVIQSPHLSLFGTATPEQFWRAFGSAALEDGSVARFLVMPLNRIGMKDPTGVLTPELQADIVAIADARARQQSQSLSDAGAVRVPVTPEAETARKRLVLTMASCAEYADLHGVKGAAPILSRVAENAAKIALVSAVGRSPFKPHISLKDFNIGHAIARWSARTMIQSIGLFVADNDIERNANEVERFIFEGKSVGRAKNKIQRKFRKIRPKDLLETLGSLVEQGGIRLEKVEHDGAGRPGLRYFSTADT
jgi:hypothetical protein